MIKLTESEKQELAQDVAKFRGWMVWHNDTIYRNFLVEKANLNILCCLREMSVKDYVLHDSQFLPMVREMEERGFVMRTSVNSSHAFVDRIDFFFRETGYRACGAYSIKDHGHMIALCLAVRDAIKIGT